MLRFLFQILYFSILNFAFGSIVTFCFLLSLPPFPSFLFFFSSGIEARVSCIVGNSSTTQLYLTLPWTCYICLLTCSYNPCPMTLTPVGVGMCHLFLHSVKVFHVLGIMSHFSIETWASLLSLGSSRSCYLVTRWEWNSCSQLALAAL